MRNLLRLPMFLLLALLVTGCATKIQAPELTLPRTAFRTPVSHAISPEEADKPATDSFIYVSDPLERLNRSIYAFNAGFDEAVFLPLVRTYEFVLPTPLRDGVSNAIDNLNEVPVLANCILQGKLRKSGITVLRFVVNSTLGVVGLFDPATGMGLARQDEDFGQTFGVWGMGPGPYVVLPIYGPSNVRDTLGTAVEGVFAYYQMEMIYDLASVEDREPVRQANTAIRAVDKRARMPFRYYTTGTPFEYDFLRFLYAKKREVDVQK